MTIGMLIFICVALSATFVIGIYLESKGSRVEKFENKIGLLQINTRLNNELETFVSSSELSNNDLSTFLPNYLKLIFKYVKKAKKSVIVYNYPINKKNIPTNPNDVKLSIIRDYYKEYFKTLENEIDQKKLSYKRVFLAPSNNHSNRDQSVIKILYKQYVNHIKIMLKPDNENSVFCIAYNDFINYNFLIIDDKYLLIELYKQTKEGHLIPDNLFVFEKKTNSENDIVSIHNNLILKTDLKPIKPSYFETLMSNVENDRKKKISKIEGDIKRMNQLIDEKKTILGSLDILMDEQKEIKTDITKKREEVARLNSIIDALNFQLNHKKEKLSELKKEHKYLMDQDYSLSS